MSKKWPILSLVSVVAFLCYYFLGAELQARFLPLTTNIRLIFFGATDGVRDALELHSSQAETIASLKAENAALKEAALLYKSSLREMGYKQNIADYEANGSNVLIQSSKALSYSNLPNLYRLWIDFKPRQNDANDVLKAYGIIYPAKNKIDSVACGIAIKNSSRGFEAYLNGDSKCSYGVFIGKSKAPGILYGRNQDKLIVKYIPTWMEINQGDEVITSGLDNIFFEGVRVGSVKSVTSNSSYKEALVEGYYKPLSPNYFYVIERIK